MPGQIKVEWPIVHNDVLARVNIGAKVLGGVRNATKLVKRYSRKTSQGADQLAIDVDSKLIQNSQRRGKQGEMINRLYIDARIDRL